MDLKTGDTSTDVMGRLKTIAPREDMRGHSVRALAGGRILDSSTTDSAGRFHLGWSVGTEEKTTIELLGVGGAVIESVDLSAAELVSPAVVGFSGRRVVGPSGAPEAANSRVVFEADGDYPLLVTSSCIDVALSWKLPPGGTASILSDGEILRDRLPVHGSLKVAERGIRKYTLRTWPQGASPMEYSDRTLEVRRYPSLSLVSEGTRFRSGSLVDVGVSISCPAGEGGLKVRILSSDPELVPSSELAMPAGSAWVNTKVRLGTKSGRAEVAATAPGHVRDGVIFVVE